MSYLRIQPLFTVANINTSDQQASQNWMQVWFMCIKAIVYYKTYKQAFVFGCIYLLYAVNVMLQKYLTSLKQMNLKAQKK